MKLLGHLVGLLIVGLVVVPSTRADISLKLKQQQQQQQQKQQYLPPASNDQQQFEESKYANSKYQVFEVHNHFDASAGQPSEDKAPVNILKNNNNNNHNNNNNNHNNNNNAPRHSEEIRIEHINAPPGFPLDDPNLDATLLNVAEEDDNVSQQTIVKDDGETTPSTNNNIPVPFPSNYRHEFPEKSTPKPTEFVEVRDDYQKQQQPTVDAIPPTDYLPPLDNGVGSGQQYSQQLFENSYKEPGYLPPSSEETPFKGPGYLPPQAKPFKGSPYLPPIPGSAGDSNPFKGADYLPPQGSGSGDAINSNNPFKGPDYLPPQQRGSGNTNSNNPFKGPDYLPPQPSAASGNPFKGPDYLPPQPSAAAGNPFKGPDYLPPHPQQDAGQHSQNPNNPFKGPAYLPPHIGGGAVGEPFRPSNAFKGPDYLPPTGNHHHQQQQGSQNGNLPPGYDFQKPLNAAEAIAELHTLPEQSEQYQQDVTVQSHIQVDSGRQQSSNIVYGSSTAASSSSYQAPGYLAPAGFSAHTDPSTQQGGSSGYLPPSYKNNANSGQAGREGKSYGAAGYLPPGYDYQKPSESEVQGQNYQQTSQSYGQQQSYGSGSSQQFQGQQQNFAQQSGYLPPTNAPASVTSSFKGPDYLPPTGAPAFKGPDYLPPTGSGFQTPGYLPPAGGNPGFKGPDYLPPLGAPGRQQTTYQSSDYLPPTAAPVQPQSTYMHPLSSYMTSVQPYERYGSTRKPFPQYGPPPSQNIPFFPVNNEVAPMYKEPASRPQYYAPAMSYGQNAVTTQTSYSSYNQQTYAAPTLNQQARQTLRTFMPKDIRQDITAARGHVASNTGAATAVVGSKVHSAGSASAKIRTVQIFNPNTVKTLKVLESLDHAGVKTIKILGSTNVEPTGEHRVVKVVSGHEQTVQTVKIFNDQQDVTHSGNAAQTTDVYLPPRRKRNSQHKASNVGN